MAYHALNLFIVEVHHFLENWKALSAIHRVGWLQTSRPSTDNNISLTLELNHIPNEIRVHERHITGRKEDMLCLMLVEGPCIVRQGFRSLVQDLGSSVLLFVVQSYREQ